MDGLLLALGLGVGLAAIGAVAGRKFASLVPTKPLPLAIKGLALLDKLHPDAKRFALDVFARAFDEGIVTAVQITSARRLCATQNALYAQGRTTPGQIVTHARGCQSWHVAGRAVDFLPTPASGDTYRKIGDIAKSLGGVWGGDFKVFDKASGEWKLFPDLGHIEYHPGLTINDVCPDPDKCVDHDA